MCFIRTAVAERAPKLPPTISTGADWSLRLIGGWNSRFPILLLQLRGRLLDEAEIEEMRGRRELRRIELEHLRPDLELERLIGIGGNGSRRHGHGVLLVILLGRFLARAVLHQRGDRI